MYLKLRFRAKILKCRKALPTNTDKIIRRHGFHMNGGGSKISKNEKAKYKVLNYSALIVVKCKMPLSRERLTHNIAYELTF